ncbi:MAG TPA: protein kinase [Pyrinomonadaceae bacterium]|nr:protein kinase [Pyrinomonadaceae bacterium]
MNCPSCQQILAENAQFCSSCGVALARVNAATQIDIPKTTDNSHTANTPKHNSRVGQVLDAKYELVEQLGEGGMGTVYRARRLHIGDEVAVKLLHPDLLRQEQAVERFRREARSAAMISHQNVVSIHDFSDATSTNSEAYIVMELVKGESLATLLQREGRMLPARAVALMQEICAGVGVAHRQGLLHRDLKPDNVIVTPASHEGEAESAKVVDFGLAKVRDIANATALTHTGAVLGTLYYMSPEQCNGEELDARADVYSLGAMFYEMLSGRPPFRANNLAGLISKHLNEPPTPFPEALQIPPALAQVCFRALAKSANQRQPDAIGFGRELKAAMQASQAASLAPTIRLEAPPKTKSQANKWIAAGLGAVFLLVVVVAGAGLAVKLLMDRRRASEPPDNYARQSQTASTTNAPTAKSETDPANTMANLSATNLKGTWTGSYGPLGQTSKLVINHQNGNKLDGVLQQGAIRVAFQGTVDSSGAIVMKQTSVLSGEGWSLGEDHGKVSADGKTMSGTGKDSLGGSIGISYEWSFSRQ